MFNSILEFWHTGKFIIFLTLCVDVMLIIGQASHFFPAPCHPTWLNINQFLWKLPLMAPSLYPTFDFKRHYCFQKCGKEGSLMHHTIIVVWATVKPWNFLCYITAGIHNASSLQFLSSLITWVYIHSDHTFPKIQYFLILETSVNSVIPKCCRIKLIPYMRKGLKAVQI